MANRNSDWIHILSESNWYFKSQPSWTIANTGWSKKNCILNSKAALKDPLSNALMISSEKIRLNFNMIAIIN